VGEASDEKVLTRLMQRAVLNVFKRTFAEPELADVVKAFEGGLIVKASDLMPSADYVKQVAELRGLRTAATKLGATEPAAVAAAIEFILEGLHLSKKLNKDVQAGSFRYRG
jgi:magnesium chelatase subunit I